MNGHAHVTNNSQNQSQSTAPVPSTSQPPLKGHPVQLEGNAASRSTGLAPSAGTSTPTQRSSVGPLMNSQDAIRDYDLAAYLLSEGFSNGRFADCRLDVQIANSSPSPSSHPNAPVLMNNLSLFRAARIVYMLHKLILARSPVLLARLQEVNGQDLMLHIPDENVTQESLLIVLGYLYSSQARHQLQPSNARAVLAAAVFLGQQDLSDQAVELCRQALTDISDPADVVDWIRFIEATAPSNDESQPWRYGRYAVYLRQTLMHHLAYVLPRSLSAFATNTQTPNAGIIAPSQSPSTASSEGQQKLVAIFALLPFSVFKAIIENSQFPPGDMERFAFAKRCISERKRLQGSAAASESAVLAFGNSASDKASNVEVISKGRRGRQFWKVGE